MKNTLSNMGRFHPKVIHCSAIFVVVVENLRTHNMIGSQVFGEMLNAP